MANFFGDGLNVQVFRHSSRYGSGAVTVIYVYLYLRLCPFSVLPLVVSALVLTRLSRSSFPATIRPARPFPLANICCVSSMRTGSKHLHSLVNGGALLPVATERRRNAPKRGGAAGPKVDLPRMWHFACYQLPGFDLL